jgi:outer membrane protein assembly factor BamB
VSRTDLVVQGGLALVMISLLKLEVIMKKTHQFFIIVNCLILLCSVGVFGQDWPQWRGPDRDAKVTKFAVPDKWPDKLTQKWKISVGEGTDSTPALVGDKLYVFTRQGSEEVILCLNAETGKQIWKDSYEATANTGGDRDHAGPRSSPAVADGMVVTFGITGTLSCLDVSGNLKWRKNDFPGDLPRFNAAMSPIIEDGLCIGQFGGEENGAVAAYDRATGEQKWKWVSPGTGHSSPNVMTVGDTKMAVVMTVSNVVGIKITDGTILWEMPFEPGRHPCVTPIIDGQNVICCGGGSIKAIAIKKEGDKYVVNELWNYTDNAVEYNTPVLKDGLLFAISNRDNYFCVDTKTGKTAWTQPASTTGLNSLPVNGVNMVFASYYAAGGGNGGMRDRRGGEMPGPRGGEMRGPRGGGRGGRGGPGGFGSVVDAGKVIVGLNSSAKMVVLEPSKTEYKELASYQVSDGQTYAYPVVSGNRIYIKDQVTLAMFTIE